MLWPCQLQPPPDPPPEPPPPPLPPPPHVVQDGSGFWSQLPPPLGAGVGSAYAVAGMAVPAAPAKSAAAISRRISMLYPDGVCPRPPAIVRRQTGSPWPSWCSA